MAGGPLLFFCLGGAPTNSLRASSQQQHKRRYPTSSPSPQSPSALSAHSSPQPPEDDNDGFVLDPEAAKSFQTLYFDRPNEITPRPFSQWVAQTAKV